MKYFNYEKVAKEANITPDEIEKLCSLIRKEFPFDEMMYELHVLRACMSIRDGHFAINDFINYTVKT